MGGEAQDKSTQPQPQPQPDTHDHLHITPPCTNTGGTDEQVVSEQVSYRRYHNFFLFPRNPPPESTPTHILVVVLSQFHLHAPVLHAPRPGAGAFSALQSPLLLPFVLQGLPVGSVWALLLAFFSSPASPLDGEIYPFPPSLHRRLLSSKKAGPGRGAQACLVVLD